MEVLQEGRESKGGGGGRERAWTTIRMGSRSSCS